MSEDKDAEIVSEDKDAEIARLRKELETEKGNFRAAVNMLDEITDIVIVKRGVCCYAEAADTIREMKEELRVLKGGA